MDIKKRNPKMNNVYCEIGSFFNVLAVTDPVLAAHGLGKNIKYYGSDHVVWGTDCLWWGSPQWGIDALRRFQISAEMCEKFGYKPLTKEDKARSSDSTPRRFTVSTSRQSAMPSSRTASNR
jgi:hypothetical protein